MARSLPFSVVATTRVACIRPGLFSRITEAKCLMCSCRAPQFRKTCSTLDPKRTFGIVGWPCPSCADSHHEAIGQLKCLFCGKDVDLASVVVALEAAETSHRHDCPAS